MRIYVYDSAIEQTAAQRVTFLARPGYVVAHAATAQALRHDDAQHTVVEGEAITRIDAGLTLDEAHASLTDGLTKAEIVALGADFGLSLSDSSLKADLLDAIRTHLEAL